MWFFIALASSLSEACKDIWFSNDEIKKSPHLVKSFWLLFASSMLAGLFVIIVGVPDILPDFWLYVSIHAVIMAIAMILMMHALATGPISMILPITALTPILLIFTTPIMTDDKVTAFGWIGVIVASIGIYAVLHPGYDEKQTWYKNIITPLLIIFTNKGALSMFCFAILASVMSNLDRLCIERANGPFYILVDEFFASIILILIMLSRRMMASNQNHRAKNKIPHHKLFLGGIMFGVAVQFQMWALTLTVVPYVIIMKRTTILWSSVWEYALRKKRNLTWYRILGPVLVIAGIVIILLLGT